MSLRWKISLAVVAVAVAVVGAIFAISQLTFAQNFQRIEDEQAREMARRASNSLGDDIQSLDTLNHDWAAWDDTYNFVQHPEQHQSYITDNPTDTTFASDGLNFILIINNAGDVVYSKGFNLSDNADMPVPDSLVRLLSDSSLAHRSIVDDGVEGVLLLPEGPLMLSSQPILTSDGEGPVAGTIIMARFVDSTVIADLQHKVLVPVALVPITNMPAGLQATSSSSKTQAATVASVIDSRSIAGYALVNDIQGNPALILKVLMPRDIYAQSTATMGYFLLFLLGVGVLLVLTLNVLLGKIVTSRIRRVGAYIGEITTTGDLSKRLPAAGSDELTRLSKDLNSMVEALQESHHFLELKQESEQKLRLTVESVAENIAATDLSGNITDLNDSKVRVHGYSSKEELIGRNALDLVSPEDRAGARDNMEEALETGRIGGGEYVMLKKDGSTFFAECSTALLKDAEARPIGFVVSTKDITARKLVEQRVQRLNRVLGTIRNVNQLIVREKDSEILMQKSCDTLVENGCYRLGWILLVDEASHVAATAVAESSQGSHADFIEQFTAGKYPPYAEPLLAEGSPPVFTSEDGLAARLEYNGRVYGIVGVSIEGDAVVDSEEQGLFREVVGDISFALWNIEREDALNRSEASLSEAQRIAHLGSWTWDIQSKRLQWSDEIGRILGLSRKQVGPGYEQIFACAHPNDRGMVQDSIRKALIEESHFDFKHRVVRPDGLERVVRETGEVVRDDDGKPVRVVATMHDITDRTLTEEKLRQSEEKYSTIVEKSNDGIVILQDGIVKFANSRANEITGFGHGEATGKAFVDFIKPSFRPIVTVRYKRRMAGEQAPEKYEITILTKDGREIPVEISANQIDFEGRPADMAMIRDITERKHAEHELDDLNRQLRAFNAELEEKIRQRTHELEIATRTAEAANRAKSDFLASMSHELRTPLNAVIGFSQLLQEPYFGTLNDKQTEYVADILDSGKHLLSLINDILDLSKVEAGKLELEISNVKIADLLKNSLVMVREKALAHNISLEVQTTEAVNDMVIMADERRLKQVMFNLLSNAAKFTPDGGAIRLEATEEAEELIVSVSDTGIGVTPEEQKRLFEPFYQASYGAKDKTPGTGLGLAITRRIVEKHGGRIWMESGGRNKGSRFSFTLPARVPAVVKFDNQ